MSWISAIEWNSFYLRKDTIRLLMAQKFESTLLASLPVKIVSCRIPPKYLSASSVPAPGSGRPFGFISVVTAQDAAKLIGMKSATLEIGEGAQAFSVSVSFLTPRTEGGMRKHHEVSFGLLNYLKRLDFNPFAFRVCTSSSFLAKIS